MNILLNIPDDVVGKYQSEADKDKRSRKNLMEKVLTDYFERPKSPIKDAVPNSHYREEKPPPPPRKSVEQWIYEKREIPDGDTEIYQQWFKALTADPWLTESQKSVIKKS